MSKVVPRLENEVREGARRGLGKNRAVFGTKGVHATRACTHRNEAFDMPSRAVKTRGGGLTRGARERASKRWSFGTELSKRHGTLWSDVRWHRLINRSGPPRGLRRWRAMRARLGKKITSEVSHGVDGHGKVLTRETARQQWAPPRPSRGGLRCHSIFYKRPRRLVLLAV